jgi:peroxiredoxin Q/BCP
MPQLKAGDKAPAFSLQDQSGKTVTLAQFKGKKLLIYFYPKASTPGCTVQSCNVRDARQAFSKKGTAVIGVSPDKPSAQQKFDEKFGLGFPLLADTEHAMAEAYGVWGEKSMYGKKYFGIIRSSFLVDEKGKIAGAWYRVSPGDTVPEAMAALGKG